MRITNKWEMLMRKDCTLYDSNYMTFWKRENYEDNKNNPSCHGLGREGRTKQAKQRGF